MDDLDKKIIELLQGDGRASNARIARDVGVSEGTVRRRLRRLVQDEIIRVVAVPDPEKMGYSTLALVGIQADPDKIDDVAKLLALMDETQYVSLTTGSFDIFISVALPSSEALGVFLRRKVGMTPGIRRTETFVNLAIRKKGYGILV
ncbi:MAG: Lrp/AsnC family transcriptional regulator [Chloroflexi bacterium]|nr:Lrp/AsnC family transcriptional regulator [Chloroflexota bacterium]MBI4198650.1 Lrp/AsnC family transcriptional regulator [Chloroflexota bacterium]